MTGHNPARRSPVLLRAAPAGSRPARTARLIGAAKRLMQSIFNGPSDALDRFERRARKRASVESIACLHDSILKDIGVNRSEIRYISRSLTNSPDRDHRKTSHE